MTRALPNLISRSSYSIKDGFFECFPRFQYKGDHKGFFCAIAGHGLRFQDLISGPGSLDIEPFLLTLFFACRFTAELLAF